MDVNLKKLLVAEKDLAVAEATIRSLRLEIDRLREEVRFLKISEPSSDSASV